jgi:two-component system, NarL family, sensor histidine kinase DesK
VTSFAPDTRAPADERFVRGLATLAVGVNVLLTVIELLRMAVWQPELGDARGAALAAVPALALHLRHVDAGLRGERPAGGAWTLAALALVNVLALWLVGVGWLMNLASLAVSVLLVVRGPWAAWLAGLVVLAPFALFAIPSFFIPSPSPSIEVPSALYFVLTIGWRTVTQYVPTRLVAAIRQLDATRRELAEQAVVGERLRIDAQLGSDLGPALERIIARARTAISFAGADAGAAAEELRRLVGDARRTITDARRVAAGFRDASLRLELDAAVALLAAAGARTQLAVEGDVPLDVPAAPYRHVIRNAIDRALLEDVAASYVLRVQGDHHGAVRIALVPDEAATAAGGSP